MTPRWQFAPILVLGLCMGILAACSDSTGPVPTRPDEEIVPPTTKVLDATTRAALETVSADGTLHFRTSTPTLSRLAPGDVVVSDVAAAAPYGLFRKVTAVRSVGGQVIVDTEGALLTDAVHQGHVELTWELSLDDIQSSQVFHPGVLLDPQTSSSLAGLSYNFDTDLGTGGRVQVTGSASIWPILDVDLRLTCEKKYKGVCYVLPTVIFMTRVGVEENANLVVHGNASWQFDRELAIAQHTFSPKTVFLAGIPVVFVPKLTIYLKADGSLSASLDYSVQQNLTLAVGFRYNSKSGIEDLSERTHAFARQGPSFAGQADVRAAIGARFELLVWGIAGPFGSLQVGPQLAASVTGLSADVNVLWRFDGCIWMFVGMKSIQLLNINYEKEVYRACANFAQGVNLPPAVGISSPNQVTQIYRGIPISLVGTAYDPEGGAVTCRWTSSTLGDPLPVTGCQASVTFPATGPRTLTLTGTDPAGASATAQVAINVQEQPDILVTIATPLDNAAVGPNATIQLSGSASGGATPHAFMWKIAFPVNTAGEGGTVYEIGGGASRSWRPSDTLTLGPCDGILWGRLILEATDAVGAAGSGQRLIMIGNIC
jgi:hypothetical protein